MLQPTVRYNFCVEPLLVFMTIYEKSEVIKAWGVLSNENIGLFLFLCFAPFQTPYSGVCVCVCVWSNVFDSIYNIL